MTDGAQDARRTISHVESDGDSAEVSVVALGREKAIAGSLDTRSKTGFH